MAADSAQRQQWAVRGAVAIARRLAQDREVMLVDLQCRVPSALEAVLEVEEGPGIVDVLFRGASFTDAARRSHSEPFFFIPLGDEPPPAANFYGHPGWAEIAGRLNGNNAVLLACVSADDWLEAGPITGFEACIVLNANEGEVSLPPRAKRIGEAVAPPEVRQVGRRDTYPSESALPRSDVAIQAVASGDADGAQRRELETDVDRGAEEGTGGSPIAGGPRVAGLPSGPRFVLFPASRGQRVPHRRRRKRSRRRRAVRAAVTAVLVLAAALSVWLAVWLAVVAGSCRTRAGAQSTTGGNADFASADQIETERPVRSGVWTCLISEVESRLLGGESEW